MSRVTLIFTLVVLSAGKHAAGQDQQTVTLWSFLGITQAAEKISGMLVNPNGKLPAFEAKPPVKKLADPANLESEIPAIKKAAQVKQAEDLKAQKIKAIRYLVKIGCGCYDVDGGITEALLAATRDCTEEVRFATVQAIIQSARADDDCDHCHLRGCCSEKIVNRLTEMAYEFDDKGHRVEPSARVRLAAERAIELCCPGDLKLQEEVSPPEREAAEPESAAPVPPAPSAASHSDAPFAPVVSLNRATRTRTPRLTRVSTTIRNARISGEIIHTDARRRLAHVHFAGAENRLPVGTRLLVFKRSSDRRVLLGELQVLESFPGSVNAQATAETKFSRLANGDKIAVQRVSRSSR
ncbi:MAG TPA: hypothetical protein DCE55_01795 [Planctomycetaceae bacterium]|nr:hypothetical protein [Planctomycetaceae bacterium]